MEVAYILGDGIGPEIVNGTIKIINESLKKNNKKIDWTKISLKNILSEDEIKKYKFILKGPTTTPQNKGHYSLNVELRRKLNLYASLRKFENLISLLDDEKLNCPKKIVLIADGLEGIYSGLEISKKQDTEIYNSLSKKFGNSIFNFENITLRTSSNSNNQKLMKFVKKYYTKNKIKKIVVTHKADIMKKSEGGFLREARKVLSKLPNYSELIGGPIHTKLIRNPSEFELIVSSNFLRCTLSHLLAGLFGGLAFGPGCNYGDYNYVYESTHGAVPKYAGRDIADPISMILSGCLMLEDIGWKENSKMIKNAIKKTIEIDKVATQDITRKVKFLKTIKESEFINQVIKNL